MTREPSTVPGGTETPGVHSARQEAVALLVAAGLSLAAAARKAKVPHQTVKNWSAGGPAFKARVLQLRAEMTGQALGRLVDSMTSAADTLGFLARKGKSEMVRLSAARAVLELGVKLRETVELEERIRKLEEGAQR